MPLETYVDQREPEDQNATIWRFMDGMKFRDLITTSELYFCRSDRFQDDDEGMPPEDFFPDLNPLDLRDRRTIDDFNGCAAQFREAFYINCWHQFRDETWKMWKEYGEDGVAISSQYAKLKSALAEMTDRTFIGLVQYEPRPIMRGNLFSFITTKRAQYAAEHEVRAFLWIPDPHAGINRHVDGGNRVYPRPLTPPDASIPQAQRRKVDLRALITEVIVTPWALTPKLDEIANLLAERAYTIPVRPSALTPYRQLLP